MKTFEEIYFNDILLEAERTERKGLFQRWFNKPWTLKDEFEAILPVIYKKVNRAFSNMCGANIPGPLTVRGNGEVYDITPINIGTQTPGFTVNYILDDDYVLKNVAPALLNTNLINNKSNEKFKDYLNTPDQQFGLIISLNAVSNEVDLSEPDVKVEKFSINKWRGQLFLGALKNDSNITIAKVELGDITVNVDIDEDSISKLMLKKLEDNKNEASNFYSFIADTILTLAFRKPNAQKEKIKKDGVTAEILCSIEFKNGLHTSTDNILEKLTEIIEKYILTNNNSDELNFSNTELTPETFNERLEQILNKSENEELKQKLNKFLQLYSIQAIGYRPYKDSKRSGHIILVNEKTKNEIDIIAVKLNDKGILVQANLTTDNDNSDETDKSDKFDTDNKSDSASKPQKKQTSLYEYLGFKNQSELTNELKQRRNSSLKIFPGKLLNSKDVEIDFEDISLLDLRTNDEIKKVLNKFPAICIIDTDKHISPNKIEFSKDVYMVININAWKKENFSKKSANLLVQNNPIAPSFLVNIIDDKTGKIITSNNKIDTQIFKTQHKHYYNAFITALKTLVNKINA